MILSAVATPCSGLEYLRSSSNCFPATIPLPGIRVRAVITNFLRPDGRLGLIRRSMSKSNCSASFFLRASSSAFLRASASALSRLKFSRFFWRWISAGDMAFFGSSLPFSWPLELAPLFCVFLGFFAPPVVLPLPPVVLTLPAVLIRSVAGLRSLDFLRGISVSLQNWLIFADWALILS